jgi:phage repressor protein C with HTH and peptisase S24 domain
MDKTSSERRDTYAAALGERIRVCRAGATRDDFAGALDIHINTLGKFERGDTLPDAFMLVRIAEIGQRPLEWLLQGESKAADVCVSTQAVESGEYLFVPHFDVAMSAGNGVFCDVEHVISMRPFDLNFIRNDLGIPHTELALVSVVGNSMEPYLRSRDIALLDLRVQDVLTEGVHAIRLDGALMIKRVQRLPGRVLRVSSANSDYQPFEIDGNDDDSQRDFSVLGRVRWGGIKFD